MILTVFLGITRRLETFPKVSERSDKGKLVFGDENVRTWEQKLVLVRSHSQGDRTSILKVVLGALEIFGSGVQNL